MISENKKLKDKISILVNYYNIKDFDKLIEGANRILKKILTLMYCGIY